MTSTTPATQELATLAAVMALQPQAIPDRFPMGIIPAMLLMVIIILELATLMVAMALLLPATLRRMKFRATCLQFTTLALSLIATTPATCLTLLEPATVWKPAVWVVASKFLTMAY